MKTTLRIPTGILAQVLTEGLGMDTPIEGGDPIELEFNMKARELPAYAKAVGDVIRIICDLMDEDYLSDDDPEDGTSPHTIVMDDPDLEEMFPDEEAA